MSRIIKLLPFLFLRVHTYSNGPPVRACKSMIPEHDGGGSLSTDTPYTLAVSDKYLKSGETLKLKFARSGNLDFRGFLIQARDQNSDKIIGTFTSIDRTTTRRLHCLSERDPPDAISHTTGEPKSSITATWTAPEFYGQENRTAVFYFTVVYIIDQQKLKSEETAAAAQELPSPYLGCGTKKGCFGFPGRNCVEESSCKGLFTHKYLEKNKRFNFALAGEVEENGYIAAGFSHGDSIMGDDIIISCRKTARGGVIALGWNDGRNSVDRQMGLNIRNYEIRENNGMMICKFQVNDELIISKATLNDKLKVDLKEDSQYYLLLAKGSLSSDGTKLSKHMDKSATSNPIDFKSTTIVKAGSYILYQLHGIFMVIAWLGCSSMGMLIARYYKNTWTKIQIADKDLWFVIHQILMITALVLSLLAAIFILSKAGFFPYDSKFISNNPHPVIGGLTIGLSLIQPIMGALRPTRGTRFRPYFNIGHWFSCFFIIHIIFHIGLSIQSHMIDEDTNKIADSQGNMRQDSRRDQVGAICRKLSLVGKSGSHSEPMSIDVEAIAEATGETATERKKILRFLRHPINDFSQPIEVPDVMYRLKPINDVGEIREKGSLSFSGIESLEKRQESILHGLTGLKAHLSAYKVSLGLDPIPTTSCNSFSKQDIVIFAHPSYPPYGILLAFHQLKSKGLKIYTSCHVHSSITCSLPETAQDFLPSHNDNLTRPEADLIITIIWKKLGDRDATTVLSPLMKHSSIKGEINILRYLARLYPSIWNYEDLIWREGSERKQMEEIIFKNLESTFLLTSSSSPFFGGGPEPGILDLISWSIVTRDHGKLAVPSTALKKWLTSCNKVCAFYGSRQHRLSSHRHRRVSHGTSGHNRKTARNLLLDVESDYVPGSLVSRQWPLIPDVIKGDSSNLDNGVVASRRMVLLKNPDRKDLSNYTFSGVSLKSLEPHISTISSSFANYFKETLQIHTSLLLTVYGELIQKGTATSREDKFRYRERGFLPGNWYAFGVSIVVDQTSVHEIIEKLRVIGFHARSVKAKGLSGEPLENDHIIVTMNQCLEKVFNLFQLPTIPTESLPFSKLFSEYEGKLLQPDSCEGVVITLPPHGASFKWKQCSGGYSIKNGNFFKNKSTDPRYSDILQIMKKVAGISKDQTIEDLLNTALESARTKYPFEGNNRTQDHIILITKEILEDLKDEKLSENEVYEFVMKHC
ncbi:unnamed protein product [Lepeophtheirus salmonis]|uniref:(salmon louse) hypothetical protein n=1 Tax=Lepeophtheirus salmonis TaxID=72036 RepID=A0A7R8D219_LEPSM|nr:unnamed protein product [Lepeophtheirus salmonis]CAF2971618.1 unnamed protein product [Lepeophtheirus salmonis]